MQQSNVTRGGGAGTRGGIRGGREYQQAIDFYETKLLDNPHMAKNNNNLAVLMDTKGKTKQAEELYRHALDSTPNNVMIRNDYALHLARMKEYKLATKEFEKGLIVVEEQPTLHMNMGAVQARTGKYDEAFQHAQRARELRPELPMNLRNLAKLQNLTGDSRTALATNLEAINLERQGYHGGYINTDVYRASAVQSVTKGDKDQALQLVREARLLEGKLYQSPTTQRTNELIAQIIQRKGDKVRQIEKEAKEAEDREKDILLRKRRTGK